jgi:hypothetical protein
MHLGNLRPFRGYIDALIVDLKLCLLGVINCRPKPTAPSILLGGLMPMEIRDGSSSPQLSIREETHEDFKLSHYQGLV